MNNSTSYATVTGENFFLTFQNGVHMVMNDVAEEINCIKNRLASAIKAYYDGWINENNISSQEKDLSVRQKLSIQYRKKYYISQINCYSKLFNDFIIVDFERVIYNGRIYTRNECVRRLTAIHMEQLREVEIPNSEEIFALMEEYEKCITVYLNIVKL